MLVDAPTEPDSSEQLAARLGPIREVVFDRIHNVVVDPAGYSIAHTKLALAPHNDFTSYNWPPSVQLLHMLVNECEGGDSSIVDAFGVVDGLRRDHPEKFDALCAVPVPFRLFSDDDESYAVNPVIDLDAGGNVRLVRFNTQQMQPIPLCEPRLNDFYAAYHELSTRMNDPGVRASCRLETGHIMLMASHRVLHGRSALRSTGMRHLQDAYFEHDNVRNSGMGGSQLPGVQPAHRRRAAAGQQPDLEGVVARGVDALGHALAAVGVDLQQRPVQEQAQLQGLACGQTERRLLGRDRPFARRQRVHQRTAVAAGVCSSPSDEQRTATPTSVACAGSISSASSRVSPAMPATTVSAPSATASDCRLRWR